jgi:hypothetical protein
VPYFKFVAEDGAHKIKSGRVSAVSLEEARRKVESAGLSLLGLEEVTGAPAIEIRGVRGRSSPIAVRSEPIEQRLSVLGSGLEFFEEASESPILPKILWFICGCGLLLGGYYVLSRPVRKPNPIVASSKIPVAVKLDGAVKLADQEAPRDLVLTVEFPDLEMRVEREWSQIKHPQGDNSYLIELDLTLLKAPTQCRVLVRRSQYADARSEIKTLASGNTLHFEALTLNRLADRPSSKEKPVPSARKPIPAGPVIQMKPRKPTR